jgi:hypothetical protein
LEPAARRAPRLFLALAGFLDRHGDAARAAEYYDVVSHMAPADASALRACVRKAELLIKSGGCVLYIPFGISTARKTAE